jgi:DNA repair protein RecO (recombination protein O)
MATRRAAPAALAAYVLHHHDWSESSLILDLYTRELGRIVAVAKGAKRPGSQLRCVLLPFQRLNIVLGSKRIEDGAEVQLLRSAEWAGGPPMPGGAGLLAGLHLNELLLRGLARHDPHPNLFDSYAATLPALGTPTSGTAGTTGTCVAVTCARSGSRPDSTSSRSSKARSAAAMRPSSGVSVPAVPEVGVPSAGKVAA